MEVDGINPEFIALVWITILALAILVCAGLQLFDDKRD